MKGKGTAGGRALGFYQTILVSGVAGHERRRQSRIRRHGRRGRGQWFGFARSRRRSIPQAVGVEHNFDALGNSELIEDAEQVILYGMFGEAQALSDFAVGQTLRDTADDFLFAAGE